MSLIYLPRLSVCFSVCFSAFPSKRHVKWRVCHEQIHAGKEIIHKAKKHFQCLVGFLVMISMSYDVSNVGVANTNGSIVRARATHVGPRSPRPYHRQAMVMYLNLEHGR